MGPAPSPPTRLLRRHVERVVGERILVAGFSADGAASLLSSAWVERAVTFLAFDYAAYRTAQSLPAHHAAIYGAEYGPASLHDGAVIYLQKGTELNRMVLSRVSRAVRPGAQVILVGENGAGIRSGRKWLESLIGPVVFSDAAQHSVLYEARAEAACGTESWIKEYPVSLAGRELTVVSSPGVFSHGKLDQGTAFLLRHLPPGLGGTILDFGCGCGVIGAAVKALHPACSVTLADANAFALAAAARTFSANGLTAQAILPTDVFSDIEGRFDWIISNPPFHHGIGTNYDIVAAFISQAAEHLHPGGRLLLVANQFLRYEPIMEQSLAAPVRVAEDGAYKILLSVKPSRAGSC